MASIARCLITPITSLIADHIFLLLPTPAIINDLTSWPQFWPDKLDQEDAGGLDHGMVEMVRFA